MLNDQTALAIITATSDGNTATRHAADGGDPVIDIHALVPPQPLPETSPRPRESWENSSHRSASTSAASDGGSSENFTTMSREFSELVIAGAGIRSVVYSNEEEGGNNRVISLAGIQEDDLPEEETNPFATVTDPNSTSPVPTPIRRSLVVAAEISVQRARREEVETKISAWQNAKIAKVNSRLKREEVVMREWESEQVQKSTSWMKKVERKLEEKRARATEKMENEVANAHSKAEERRASAEGKRGTKVAKIQELANLMRAVGRAPAKKSFFRVRKKTTISLDI